MKTKPIAFLIFATLTATGAGAANCVWNNGGPPNMTFGNYSVFSGTAMTTTTTYQILCTPGLATVKLTTSAVTGTYNRSLILWLQPVYLPYNLYTDAANTTVFGDGSAGTDYHRWTGNNTILNGTIYGTIPAGADLPPGTYADAVTANLTGGGTTTGQQFIISTVIQPECTAASFVMDFGAYDPLTGNKIVPLDSTSTVNVYCTKTTPATVALGLGANATGTQRRMTDGTGNYLNYEIYREAARTTVWNAANTNGGTSGSKLTPLGGGFIAYGRIASGQDAAVGAYTDNLQATINY